MVRVINRSGAGRPVSHKINEATDRDLLHGLR
jgi:hypothetical protein